MLFPGQGSQHVGMGADLFRARPDLLGDRADQVLGWSLEKMCLEGPEEALTATEHAQPALFALAYALWAVMSESVDVLPSGGAGHSLGEYTALSAAAVWDYDTTLDLVARRGRAMAEASALAPSGMAALIGADVDQARQVAEQRASLQLANINAPGQVVVAGGDDDISWVTENAPDLGVRRAVRLKVAGAFHTSYMAPAADQMAQALQGLQPGDPAFPVWSNTTAAPHQRDQINETLIRQMVSPVRFSESLEAMAASGVDTFVHVGPGDVTAGLAKRTVGGATVITVSSLDHIGPAAQALVSMDGNPPT